jgi:hypothetical protein
MIQLPKKDLSPWKFYTVRSKFWGWFVAIATILGFVTGGLAVYDYATREEFTIEQSVDPATMKRLKELKPGETINVEKGRPADDTR